MQKIERFIPNVHTTNLFVVIKNKSRNVSIPLGISVLVLLFSAKNEVSIYFFLFFGGGLCFETLNY